MNVFVENVKLAMAEQGLTAAEVAARAGMSQSGLSRVFSGAERATVDRVERIAQAVGKPLSELFSTKSQKQAIPA